MAGPLLLSQLPELPGEQPGDKVVGVRADQTGLMDRGAAPDHGDHDGLNQAEVDARIADRVEDFAQTGNADRVPAAKLPERTGAFTADDEAKLDGVADGAQANPLNIANFRTTDSDGQTNVNAGTVYFIKPDNSQWQSGSTNDLDVIELHPTQVPVTGNPLLDNAADTGFRSLPENRVERGGAVLLTFQRLDAATLAPVDGDLFIVQCDRILKNGDGNYVFDMLTPLIGWNNTSGSGQAWNVTITATSVVGAASVVGVLPPGAIPAAYVQRAELIGDETDRWVSYTNGFVGSGYRTGSIVLTSDKSGAPTAANEYGQPDIASGSGTIAFGRLREDADPDNFVLGDALDASDYPSGTVLYVEVHNRPGDRIVVTTTADATLVGAGDAQYLYAAASWTVVGSPQNVVNDGDYFLIAKIVPTKLRLRIPASDITGPPWLLVDGTNATAQTKNAIQGDNEDSDLVGQYRVDNTNVDRYVQLSEPGGAQLNTVRIRIPASDTDSKADLERLLKPAAWVEVGGYTLDITTNPTIATLGTGVTFTANYVVVSGAKPTGATPVNVRVVGQDVHRGQVARAAFKDENPSIGGNGGTDDQVWRRMSGKGAWGDPPPPADDSITPAMLVADSATEKQAMRDRIGALASAYDFYDSTEESVIGNVSVSDTDAIPVADINENGVIATETIDGFGKVYKAAAAKQISLTGDFNATQGVAYQLRYSDEAPTGSSDSKSFGTLLRQFDANAETTATVFDSPANRYYWFGISGGGSRTLNKRETRARITYAV